MHPSLARVEGSEYDSSWKGTSGEICWDWPVVVEYTDVRFVVGACGEICCEGES